MTSTAAALRDSLRTCGGVGHPNEDSDGTPAVVFSLEECLPVKMRAPSLNARDGLVAIEELGLVYRRLTVSSASGPDAGLGGGWRCLLW